MPKAYRTLPTKTIAFATCLAHRKQLQQASPLQPHKLEPTNYCLGALAPSIGAGIGLGADVEAGALPELLPEPLAPILGASPQAVSSSAALATANAAAKGSMRGNKCCMNLGD